MSKKAVSEQPANHIAVFQETTIRRTWHNEEWWFAIVDVVAVLAESANPTDYIKKMRLRAESCKRWLAQVGYEWVKEIENPELARARARELYQAKGYPKDWIEKRLRSIAVRGELTEKWKSRGVAGIQQLPS